MYLFYYLLLFSCDQMHLFCTAKIILAKKLLIAILVTQFVVVVVVAAVVVYPQHGSGSWSVLFHIFLFTRNTEQFSLQKKKKRKKPQTYFPLKFFHHWNCSALFFCLFVFSTIWNKKIAKKLRN